MNMRMNMNMSMNMRMNMSMNKNMNMSMIHLSRNTSFNWRICHMPYASNRNKRWYNPKNTCGKHHFLEARCRNSKAQQGWMLCFSRANQTQTYAFCTILHPYDLTLKHTLTRRRIEKQRCSKFKLPIATKVKLKLWTTVRSIKQKCGGTERHLTSSSII